MQKAKEIEYWNKNAKFYKLFMLRNRRAYEKIFDKICARLDKKYDVLELGTGPGTMINKMACCCRRLDATDISEKMLAKARKSVSADNVDFRIEDAMKISKGDGAYDVVIAVNILHVLPEPKRAMKQMKRVLKNEGLLIIPTFVHEKDEDKHLMEKVLFKSGFPEHSRWSYVDFLKYVEDSGFEILEDSKIKASFSIAYVVAKPKKEN